MILKLEKHAMKDARALTRMRFKLAVEFLAPLRCLIQEGLRTYKKGNSPMGRAMSHILTSGFVSGGPYLEIDPAKVRLSDGNLTNPRRIRATREGNTVTVSWDTEVDADESDAFGDDAVVVCAYGIGARTAVINDSAARRKDGRTSVTLPPGLTTEPVLVYLLCHSRDRKRFAKNVYLGVFPPDN